MVQKEIWDPLFKIITTFEMVAAACQTSEGSCVTAQVPSPGWAEEQVPRPPKLRSGPGLDFPSLVVSRSPCAPAALFKCENLRRLPPSLLARPLSPWRLL